MAKRKKIVPESNSTEQTKLFTNLQKTVTQYIQGRNYTPFTLLELMQKLALPDQHQPVIKEILKSLTKDGMIKLKKGRYSYLDQNELVVTGVISMHPRGFGFVKQDGPSDEGDVFIPKHLTMNAVDGDHVEIVINTDSTSDKGPEGKIVTILSRSRTHMAGIITQTSEYGEILAYVPLLGTSQRIVVKPSEEFNLEEGDRVVMKVLDWGSKDEDTECTVSRHLGHIDDPSCDITAAIEEYELCNEFSAKALKEANGFGKKVTLADMKEREDLRHLECFTIDPTTAKDFDDALSLSKDQKGHYQLTVHIADVSHYVKEGSAIDLEAAKRCNSTYFPGRCLPMLPQALSENLCSLKANVNRLALSVDMLFNEEGNLLSARIFRSVIKSSKRFTYTEAKLVLDGKKRSKHAPTLHLMVELCKKLKAKRHERGSLEFALPDLVIKVDAHGVPFDTEYVHYDITHQMVEEFMLKANETVAEHLTKQGKFLAYRIHEEPSEENLKDFSLLANAFGFKLPELPKPQDLQKLFDEALDTAYGQFLAVSYIRRMRQALYSSENLGHYGLGLTYYCHFTSPIRRYVDLVIHRTLFEECPDLKKLNQIAKQSSEQERISAKAENSVTLLKKLRLLQKIHAEDPSKDYEAVVTRVKHFGFSFEILDFLLEGFLHVSELDQDYFMFDDSRKRLVGRHSQKVYASGDRIRVSLKDVNFIYLESKWSILASRQKKTKKWPEKKWERNQKAKYNKDTEKVQPLEEKPTPPTKLVRSAQPHTPVKSTTPSKPVKPTTLHKPDKSNLPPKSPKFDQPFEKAKKFSKPIQMKRQEVVEAPKKQKKHKSPSTKSSPTPNKPALTAKKVSTPKSSATSNKTSPIPKKVIETGPNERGPIAKPKKPANPPVKLIDKSKLVPASEVPETVKSKKRQKG